MVFNTKETPIQKQNISLHLKVLFLTSLTFMTSQAGLDLPNVQIYTQGRDNASIQILDQGKVKSTWDYNASLERTCTPAPTIIEDEEKQQREFFIMNQTQQDVSFQISTISTDTTILNPTIQNNAETYTVFSSKQISFQVNYNCEQQQTKEQNQIGWARAYITITPVGSEDEKVTFSLLKICNQPERGIQYGIIILLVAAISIVWYGSRQIMQPFILEDEEQAQDIEAKHAILFVVIGSVSLVLMFFFFKYLETVLTIAILISSFSSSSIMIGEYLTELNPNSRNYNLKYIGHITCNQIIAFGIAGALVIQYGFTKNWILNNFIALFVVLLFFRIVRLPSYKVGALLLGLAFFYDIFWVFYSNRIFGQSVMAAVAQEVDLPMKFVCPSFNINPLKHCTLIGLGDLVLPGIFCAFCHRFGLVQNDPQYHIIVMLGYSVGLLTCIVFLFFFNIGQPALLYLSPGTLIPTIIYAYYQGDTQEFWDGFVDENKSEQENVRNNHFQQIEMKDETN